MDREDRVTVVENEQRFEAVSAKQVRSQRRGAVVGEEAPGHEQAETSARLQQAHGALDEELILIRVAARLRTVDAGAA